MIAEVERAIIVCIVLHELVVVRRARDHVGSKHSRALPDRAQPLQLLEVLQVELLLVVEKHEIELPVILHKLLKVLKDPHMDDDAGSKASVKVDLVGDGREMVVGLD